MNNEIAPSQPNDPAYRAVAVTPGDTTDLSDGYNSPPRGIFVGTGGNLAVTMVSPKGALAVTFKNVPSGTLLPIRVRYVMSTNTTASDIVAMY